MDFLTNNRPFTSKQRLGRCSGLSLQSLFLSLARTCSVSSLTLSAANLFFFPVRSSAKRCVCRCHNHSCQQWEHPFQRRFFSLSSSSKLLLLPVLIVVVICWWGTWGNLLGTKLPCWVVMQYNTKICSLLSNRSNAVAGNGNIIHERRTGTP